MNNFQERLLELYKYTANFLGRHNLRSFAAGGTVLGAVRHKGFIPWDDDIDLYMFRDEYEQLLSLNNELLKDGYAFVCVENDSQYYLPFGKVIDLRTSLWEVEKIPYMLGLYIDIFPLDRFANNAEISTFQANYSEVFHDYYVSLVRPGLKQFYRESLRLHWSDAIRSYLMPKFVRKKYHDKTYRRLQQSIAVLRNKDGAKCVSLNQDIGRVFEVEWFDNAVSVQFEDIKLLIPGDYDKYLTMLYGDYMTPPHIEQRKASAHQNLRYYLNLRERVSIEAAKDHIRSGNSLIL